MSDLASDIFCDVFFAERKKNMLLLRQIKSKGGFSNLELAERIGYGHLRGYGPEVTISNLLNGKRDLRQKNRLLAEECARALDINLSFLK